MLKGRFNELLILIIFRKKSWTQSYAYTKINTRWMKIKENMGRYFNLMWMVMTHFSDIKSKCLKEKVNMTIFEIFSVTKDIKKNLGTLKKQN